MPFNKDATAKQKPNVNVVLPSAPVTLTVLPSQVARLSLASPNLTVKPGGQVDAMERIVQRMLAAKLPVVAWVGPSGAKAASAGFLPAMTHRLAPPITVFCGAPCTSG